jgi:predicted nucleic acid-binding Zn ribbon protein
MEVDPEEVGPHGSDDMVLATSDISDNLGQAYRHAKKRHTLRSVRNHEQAKTLLEHLAESEEVSESNDKVTASGAVKLIAIRVQYTDWNPDNVCSSSCVQANLWTGAFNVDQQYRDSSYGRVTIPQGYGKILTVSLPVSSKSYSSCNDLSAISAAADAAVAAQYPSVVLSQYGVRVYLTGAICGIGVAYLGGSPGKAFVNSAYPDTIAHEVGHNFGMQHSNRDPGDDNYVDESYGDRSCVMGYSHVGLRGFNAIHRIENGWIPSSAVRYLSTGCMTSPVTYTLSPLSKARLTNAVVAVRAVRRNFGAYFIAFRNSDGYDANQASTYVNRVHIEYQITKGGYTQMVQALAAGETWRQPNGDMTVTVVSISSTAAVVQIKYCRPSSFSGLAGVLSCGSTISSTNVGATNLGGYGSGDKVYMMALNSAYSYTFSTCGSSLNTVLRVYSDGMYEQKSMCDNCGSCSSNQYNAVISGFTGSGYHFISVEGFNTASGTFVLSVTCKPISSKTATTPLLDSAQIPTVQATNELQ